jgi:hypothetical protein
MDLTILTVLPIFLSGVIVGMIVFHAGIIAPSLFKKFAAAEVGPFLRTVFPQLFLLVLGIGICSLLVLFLNGSMVGKIVSFITVALMGICYAIIPATNSAKDLGDETTFKRLHRLSVILTVTVLCLNSFWIPFV